MNYNQTYEIRIESDLFETLRADLNKIISRTLLNMDEKESEESVINMKLNISFVKACVPDSDGSKKTICMPKFEHKINSVMQIKSEERGRISGEYELFFDPKRRDYVVRTLSDGQMDIFTSEYNSDDEWR